MAEDSPLPFGLIGEGETVQDAIDEWMRLYSAYKEKFAKKGIAVEEVEFDFAFDVPSLLSYYSGILTNKAIAKRTGIAAATLSHYASGFRHPSPKTTAKIQDALHSFGRELQAVQLF